MLVSPSQPSRSCPSRYPSFHLPGLFPGRSSESGCAWLPDFEPPSASWAPTDWAVARSFGTSERASWPQLSPSPEASEFAPARRACSSCRRRCRWTSSLSTVSGEFWSDPSIEPFSALRDSNVLVLRISNSLDEFRIFFIMSETFLFWWLLNSPSGILNAPVGPTWHLTENPSFLNSALRPQLGSKCKTVRHESRKGNEMRNGAFSEFSPVKIAGLRIEPFVPKLVGIVATWVVFERPWTLRNWNSCFMVPMFNSGGNRRLNWRSVSDPIAILWHPVSIVPHKRSLGVSDCRTLPSALFQRISFSPGERQTPTQPLGWPWKELSPTTSLR